MPISAIIAKKPSYLHAFDQLTGNDYMQYT